MSLTRCCPRERYFALVNVLLLSPDDRTLIFVRTRADVTEVASRLCDDGFRAGGLSGEMAQAERTRTLEAFRKGSDHDPGLHRRRLTRHRRARDRRA